MVLLFFFVASCFSGISQWSKVGSYLNTAKPLSTYRLTITPIDDTLTYYELMQVNPNNKYVKENKTMGVSVRRKNKFYPINSFSFKKKIYFEVLNDSTFFINPYLISFYPTFNDFGGIFLKEKYRKTTDAHFSIFYRDSYYYEYVIRKNSSMILNKYPINSKHKEAVSLTKGMEVRSLTNVYDCKTDEESFFYIAFRKKGQMWKYGWIKSSDLSKFHFLWKVRNGEKWIKDTD